jgi:hypothetical protein
METMRQKIIHFLAANPSPSDAEFHAFALSMGYDPETLESVVYQMLGQEVQMDGEEVGEPQRDRPHPSNASTRLKAASTHFEVGHGGEYGEDRPGDETDDDCTLFDLANDAPETEELSEPVEPTEFPEAPEWQELEASTQVEAGWGDEVPAQDFGVDADGPGTEIDGCMETRAVARLIMANTLMAEDGAQSDTLSEQQRVLQGDLPVPGVNTDNALQDSMMVDGVPVQSSALTRLKAHFAIA